MSRPEGPFSGPFPGLLSTRRTPTFAQVLMSCEATVNGVSVKVQQVVDAHAYDEPVMREHAENTLREALVREILKHWKPVIKVQR